MAEKVYLVQCWDKAGVLTNNYEATIGTTVELKALKKFLLGKYSHVVLTQVTRKRGAK